MDLSSATVGQKQIITTLDAPLSVAAGAGSGKTFTLTNRIAYALIGDQASSAPFIESIDEVLAITFSRSGAAELKSRIRSLLQEEGLEEQARAVEDAWITTIHGMCSRILREHALELGIDPAFEIIEETESRELWRLALETILERWADNESQPRLKRLIEWFPPHQKGPNSANIAEFLTRLWEKTLSMPAGFESVLIPEASADLAVSLRTLVSMGEEFQAIASTWTKLGKYDSGYLAALEDALAASSAYLQRYTLSGRTLASEDVDIQAYLELVLSFPKTSAKFRSKDPEADFFAHYRETYNEIAQTLLQDAAALVSRDLLELLKLVDHEYQQLKGAARLDNTDLLRSCCAALQHHSDLRAHYQEQFKLIMVDEFQDTDLVQVAIINELSRDRGTNVMTVGDAQQSIYRFRGADVEVFFRHRDSQREEHREFQALSLPDNFRSHGDILRFVDAIFSRPAFFGDEFLSLQPKGKVNTEEDELFAELPRVSVKVIENRRKGASAEDVRVKTAHSIAEHFSRLRLAGASPRDMVILLGSMSNVGIYSRALADAGFESIITAGSVFGERTEVLLFDALLTALADRTNSTALYQVLSSPLFDLSDAAFYAIAHLSLAEDGAHASASFAQRFWDVVEQCSGQDFATIEGALSVFGLSQADQDELLRVFRLMGAALRRADRGNVHAALYSLVLDSGWLYRLQEAGAEGLAISANVFKALDFVSGWEAEHRGLYEIAAAFSAFLEVSKETPGVLATPESEFVRIMTIHASKGLEFDHVAVAEIRSGLPKSSELRLDTYEDNVLFSLRPQLSKAAKTTVDGLKAFFADEAEQIVPDRRSLSDLNTLELSDLLDQRIERGELDDAQRLLYVALTRAVKSLYLCLGFEGNKDFNYETKGMFGLLHEVLDWEKTPDPKIYAFDFGGSKPALVHHEVLLEPDEAEWIPACDERPFIVVKERKQEGVSVPVVSDRDDVVSYSSIAPDHGSAQDDSEGRKSVEPTEEEVGLEPLDPTAEQDESLLAGDEEMFPEDDLAFLKQQSATALGTAFHRLAQRAIESRAEIGTVATLPPQAYERQIAACQLTPDQQRRLELATERWFASDLCARFMSCAHIHAEVPFMIELDADGEPLFLEGEIDGLALGDPLEEGQALFIDYKTGGSDQESDAELYEKHLLQAQCYGLALIEQGYETVEANFIRVERCDRKRPDQPQIVTYSFTNSDRASLVDAILMAYRSRKD